tara:strand:- start:335 stop:499 length:165 start_codon:yes stop_codon:yes gene_type:complete
MVIYTPATKIVRMYGPEKIRSAFHTATMLVIAIIVSGFGGVESLFAPQAEPLEK